MSNVKVIVYEATKLEVGLLPYPLQIPIFHSVLQAYGIPYRPTRKGAFVQRGALHQLIKLHKDKILYLELGRDVSWFRNTLEKILRMLSNGCDDFRIQIATECLIRDIRFVYHFTYLDNLETILRYGILPRRELDSQKIPFRYFDEKRYDGFLDCISLTVGFPQCCMINKCLMIDEFCIIEIHSDIIWQYDIFFFKTNAANKFAREEALSLNNTQPAEAFRSMFAEKTKVFTQKMGGR